VRPRGEHAMRRRVVLAVAVASLSACGQAATPPAGQILLYVDTDAVLPGGSDAATPEPLFDRLRVDVVPPGAGAAAIQTNEFELTTDRVAARDASVGIRAPVGASGFTARLRLFRSAFASASGEPDGDSAIDVTVALPVVAAEGVIEVTATLHTDDVGTQLGQDTPVAPAAGRPSTSMVGTWPGAARVTCSGTARPGEACIPGGAFWLGTTSVEIPHDGGAYALRPRLVTLSPFWLADREVRVDALRASGGSPHPWTGSTTGAAWDDWCTFTPSPGPNDARPANCVAWSDARAHCRSIGADLPSEAQLEYVAGGLANHRFVWGEENPGCGDAVWGGGGQGFYGYFSTICGPASPTQAPLSVEAGKRGRDALALPGGAVVYDLAANLIEWALDSWNAPDEPCWSQPGVYRDPMCNRNSPSLGPSHVVRGGSWIDSGDYLLATNRDSADSSSPTDPSVGPALGFRCARADAP
jgi:sulfatase modifying factor 1